MAGLCLSVCVSAHVGGVPKSGMPEVGAYKHEVCCQFCAKALNWKNKEDCGSGLKYRSM